ncbi:uncharacterized protein PITG_10805 [Phytophthora infestans T30-4]|uniref:Uncharacterized protein n=1 Tax=Phytophthora infestans (strain T30-4) TaxID=403677 RepID=D0NH47_PHYIT|nr:uncharacterized protein PITG_10805 [Phytophthora infestans T30-4]EEY58686.1 hypothetical protein PITG_10805 [Phytophthora infestans T30-4]|eukprot:XP_002901630.1 hypothetical protein PITG_10805 [Phytophthora infestans T30-4]
MQQQCSHSVLLESRENDTLREWEASRTRRLSKLPSHRVASRGREGAADDRHRDGGKARKKRQDAVACSAGLCFTIVFMHNA